MRYLYIWEIKSLSVISFAKIFSHSVAYLVVLFMVSLAVQKLLCLIRSYLFIYLFIHLFLLLQEVDPKIYCCKECSAYVFL